MPYRTVCPACGFDLHIADACHDPRVTCPHCLAEVANPALATTAVPKRPPETVAALCARCGMVNEKGWRFCPYCNAALPASPASERLPSVAREVKGDHLVVAVILVVLGLLFVPTVIPLGSIHPVLAVTGVLALVFGILIVLNLRSQPNRGAKDTPSIQAQEPVPEVIPVDPLAAPGTPRSTRPHPLSRPSSPESVRGGNVATGLAVGASGCAAGVLTGVLVAGLICFAILSFIISSIETCLSCGHPNQPSQSGKK